MSFSKEALSLSFFEVDKSLDKLICVFIIGHLINQKKYTFFIKKLAKSEEKLTQNY
jgi:hypothetical protein